MDKQALLGAVVCTPEERLLLASILDRLDACRRRNIPTCSRFLTEAEQGLVEALLRRAGETPLFYGGYEGAERKVALFLPDYLSEEDISFALCELTLLHCEADRYHEASLTHRDYLGALMAIGITRETVGDILIDGRSADLIVTESAATLIERTLTSVGRCKIDCRIAPPETLHLPEVTYATVTDTVASMRLDCIVAAAFNLSRDEATKAVRGGRVRLNGREAEKPDAEVKEKDKIALRGGGKVILSQIGGLSKKGRLRVTFKIQQ